MFWCLNWPEEACLLLLGTEKQQTSMFAMDGGQPPLTCAPHQSACLHAKHVRSTVGWVLGPTSKSKGAWMEFWFQWNLQTKRNTKKNNKKKNHVSCFAQYSNTLWCLSDGENKETNKQKQCQSNEGKNDWKKKISLAVHHILKTPLPSSVRQLLIFHQVLMLQLIDGP